MARARINDGPNEPGPEPADPPPEGSHIVGRAKQLPQGWAASEPFQTMDGRTGEYQHFRGPRGATIPTMTICWTPETGVQTVSNDVRHAWMKLGMHKSPVGCPTSDTMNAHAGGSYQEFEGGMIVWHRDTGGHELRGPILELYRQLGGSAWGYPTTDIGVCADGMGQFAHFRNVDNAGELSIYWSEATGAHAVFGGIRGAWSSLGWETSHLGYPTSGEFEGHAGGRFQNFQGGMVVWHESTGAFELNGEVLVRYNELGGSGWAYPTTNTKTTPDKKVWYNHFRNVDSGDERSIYWRDEKAHEVQGPIRALWKSLDWERSVLGYPISNELDCHSGGRYQNFDGGMVVWHADTGAFEVNGTILARYRDLGGSAWGYPTTNESDAKGGCYNHFRDVDTGEMKSIYWNEQTGAAYAIAGPIRQGWEELKFEHGHLGLPTGEQQPSTDEDPGGLQQQFANGRIISNPTWGAAAADPMYWLHGFPDGSVEGHIEATLKYPGTLNFHAYFKGSDLQGHDYLGQALITSNNGMAIEFTAKGDVSSTAGGEDREHHWRDVTNAQLTNNYWQFANGSLNVNMEHSGQITGAIGDALEGLTKWFLGGAILASPTTTFWLVAGTELVSLVTGGGLAGGARIIGGTLFLAGPYGTLFALAAEAVSALMTDSRELRPEEYKFADLVFKGSLPPPDKIRIGNGSGGEGRAFTYPSAEETVFINVGDTYQSDMRDHTTNSMPNYGQFLVHELTHAWQFHNYDAGGSYIVDGTWARIREFFTGQHATYHPGFEFTEDWDNYGLEEQARIVDMWFADYYARAGSADDDFGLAAAAAVQDDRFARYIAPKLRIADPS